MEPDSTIDETTWILVFAVVVFILVDSGYRPTRARFYMFRPLHQTIFNEYFAAAIWTVAIVMWGIAFVLTMNIRSNNDWVNHLYHKGSSFDTVIALYVAAGIIIKLWAPMFCVADMIHYNSQTLTESEDVEKAYEYEQDAKKTQKLDAYISKYNIKNKYVRFALILNAAMLIAVSSAIFFPLSEKFDDTKDDHGHKNFLIVYICTLVFWIITVFGFVYSLVVACDFGSVRFNQGELLQRQHENRYY